MMLKYPEVYTDLMFVSIPTIPLELRARIEKPCKDAKPTNIDADHGDTLKDGAHVGIIFNDVCIALNLPEWRQHIQSEMP